MVEDVCFELLFEQSLNAFSLHTIVLNDAGDAVDYRFDAVNRSFETMTGLKRETILGRTVLDVLPHTEPEWIQRYGRVALTGEAVSFSSYSQELKRWYSVSAFRHKPLGFAVSFVDVTENHRATEALQAREQELNRVVEGSQLGYWDWDLTTGKVTRNHRWAEMLGYTLEEIEFSVKQWSDLQHPEDRERAWASINAHLEGRSHQHRVEYRMLCKDGSYRWILDQASIVRRDSRGRPLQMSGTHTDVTERRVAEEERERLQAQLNQSQKMESLGSLAGGVAHDMNNVLGAILTLSSTQLLRLDAADPSRKAFETIAQAAQRGGTLVHRLLEFAHQAPAQSAPVDVNAVVHDAVGLLERTTQARVDLGLDLGAVEPVLGDVGALTHAFLNVCINAIDAMPDGGRLTVSTRCEGPHVVVVFRDSGRGMPPEVLAHALDPFFTTKPVGKGTGLGLSLVYRTVQAHQGELTLESAPGMGTTVTVRLPSTTERPSQTPFAPVSTAGRSVFVVDDDDLVREVLRETLLQRGHRVQEAGRGETAWELLTHGPLPDVVILDLNMPGWGGRTTLHRLREQYPHLPIVVSTGRPDLADLSDVPGRGLLAVLAKPFSAADLDRALASVLDRSPKTC